MNENQTKCGMVLLLPILLCSGLVGIVLGWRNKQRLLGFMTGLLFGPAGLLIFAVVFDAINKREAKRQITAKN